MADGPEDDRSPEGARDADDRPTPARQGSRPPRPAPAAPRPVRPLRSAREAAEEDEKRPTPVRAAMGLPRDDTPPVDVPTRDLVVEDEAGEATWVVRTEGRTVTGLPPDSGAPLLFLTFAPPDAPDAPTREALAVGRSLDAYSDAELTRLFEGSRPLSPRTGPEPIFPGTGRSRGGRRR